MRKAYSRYTKKALLLDSIAPCTVYFTHWHPLVVAELIASLVQRSNQDGGVVMLISPWTLRALGVRPTALMHVGAHHGEERSAYISLGWTGIAWVEALPTAAAAMRGLTSGFPQERVYEGAAFSDADLTLELRVASNGQSSSVRDFGDHSVLYPDITEVKRVPVKTVLLSDIHHAYEGETDLNCDFINLDIQGAEMEALLGLGPKLQEFKWVYTEVATRELYRGQAELRDLDSFLGEHGFRRVVTALLQPEGWGDALYVSARNISRTRLNLWLIGGAMVSVQWRLRRLFHRFTARLSPVSHRV